jgi:hypothetical protein
MNYNPPPQAGLAEPSLCIVVRAARLLDVRSGELLTPAVVVVEKVRSQSGRKRL